MVQRILPDNFQRFFDMLRGINFVILGGQDSDNLVINTNDKSSTLNESVADLLAA
jgi:hypothetical protein